MRRDGLDKKDLEGVFVCFVVVLVLVSCMFAAQTIRRQPVLPPAPPLQLYRSAKALWEKGTLTASEFEELNCELISKTAKNPNVSYWQDVYTITKPRKKDPAKYGNSRSDCGCLPENSRFCGSRLLPKHSLLYPIVISPFVGLLPLPTAVFTVQLLVVFLLLLGARRITRSLSSGYSEFGFILLFFLGTQVMLFVYDLSYDLFESMIIVSGLSILRLRPLIGGIVMGSAVFVHPSTPLMTLPLSFVWLREQRKRYLSFIGVCVPILLLMIINHHLYGGFLETAYNHLPSYKNGDIFIREYSVGFDTRVFFRDFADKLFSWTHGLFVYNPGVLFLLMLLPFRIRSLKFAHWVMFFSAFLYTAYIFSYPFWAASRWGNRFLITPAVLCVIVAACICLDSGKMQTRTKQARNAWIWACLSLQQSMPTALQKRTKICK